MLTDANGQRYSDFTIRVSQGVPFDCRDPTGTIYSAEFVTAQTDQDVAVLKVNSGSTFDYVRACQQTSVHDEETLYILGFPLGTTLSVTTAKRSSISGPRGRWQIDESINPGQSGSPVFNQYGRLVGMAYGSAQAVQNIGFIVPLDHYRIAFGYAGVFLEPCTTLNGAPTLDRCLPMTRGYSIDFTKDDFSGFQTSTRAFATSFSATAGFYIASWEWRPSSAANASGVDIRLDNDRRVIRVETRLTSGPVFDRWRGWLNGTLLTSQLPDGCAAPAAANR